MGTIRENRFLYKVRWHNRLIEPYVERCHRWLIASTRTHQNKESPFQVHISPPRKLEERWNRFSISHFFAQTYNASLGILEHHGPVSFDSMEFSRIYKARFSTLYRSQIAIYIDPIWRNISTTLQQREFFILQSLNNRYACISKRYFDSENHTLYQLQKTQFTRIIQQREFHFRFFDGYKTNNNILHNQQYLGNLALVRRLFAVSWSSYENTVPPTFIHNVSLLRRKRSLDQAFVNLKKNILDNEENFCKQPIYKFKTNNTLITSRPTFHSPIKQIRPFKSQ